MDFGNQNIALIHSSTHFQTVENEYIFTPILFLILVWPIALTQVYAVTIKGQ